MVTGAFLRALDASPLLTAFGVFGAVLLTVGVTGALTVSTDAVEDRAYLRVLRASMRDIQDFVMSPQASDNEKGVALRVRCIQSVQRHRPEDAQEFILRPGVVANGAARDLETIRVLIARTQKRIQQAKRKSVDET